MPQGIEPSNLQKVFWPVDGFTKGDLLAYFETVAPFLLRELRNRPLTVKRYPDGIEGFMFYQKDTPKYAPSWVKTVTLHAGSAKRDVRYALCNTKRTLLWLANQAAHGSRAPIASSAPTTWPSTSTLRRRGSSGRWRWRSW